nr:flagellar basal body M-ring protein FliF [Nitrosomonas sp.]
MATVPSESNTTSPVSAMSLGQFSQLSNQKKLGLILSAAAVVALLAGALMWSQTPEYRVLYN